MISGNAGVLVILGAAIAIGGCSRSRSAGERMITDDQTTPAVVQNEQPIVNPLPTQPPTIAVTRPATTTVAITKPTTTTADIIVPSVSTRPVGTNPTTRLQHMWVPQDADTATRMRNWKPAVAYYASGNAVAGPTYRINPPEPRTREADDIILMDAYSNVLSVAGLFAAPFWMVITPPNTPIEYTGVEFPPSYTLTEPLPDGSLVKIPGIINIRRESMSPQWDDRVNFSEPAGSTEKRIRGSSLDSLPGDRR